jgi:serine/threonine-protein kinase
VTAPTLDCPLTVGRYAVYDQIASDGFASVHVGALMGPLGFSRTVTIRRLDPTFARDPEFVVFFMEEVRAWGRILHPNVLAILDVVALQGEVLLIMDDVVGVLLSDLVPAPRCGARRIPMDVAVRIVADVLGGLHGVHETTGDRDCHSRRCLSPRNVLVGESGVSQVVDLIQGDAQRSQHPALVARRKDILSYQAPEQLHHGHFDRRSDVFSAGLILWELLVGRRAFGDPSVRTGPSSPMIPRPASVVAGVPPLLDLAVMKALRADPSTRFATTAEMAEAIERATCPATTRGVARWLRVSAGGAPKAGASVVPQPEACGMVQPPRPLSEEPVSRVTPTPPPVTPTIAPITVNSDGGAHDGVSEPPPRTAFELSLTVAFVAGTLAFAVWVATQGANDPAEGAPDAAAPAWATTLAPEGDASEDGVEADGPNRCADRKGPPDGSADDTGR